MMKYLELYVVTIIHLGAIPAVLYPLVWHMRGKWRANRIGRALMHKAQALAVLFIISVAGIWIGHGTWWALVYAVTLTWVVWALWRQFVVLVQVTDAWAWVKAKAKARRRG